MVSKKAATVPVDSVPAAPVKEAAKPKAAKKPTVEPTVEPIVEPSPAKVDSAAPVVTEEVSSDTESPLDTVFVKLTTALTLFKEIQTSMKALQKNYEKMRKVVEKQEKKKQNARTTPSGFAKPTKISDELCVFLNVAKGSEMSRTQVTRELNAYIKAKNLYDPKNRRIILPDATMKKILVLEPNHELSFFTLQRAIKHHFQSGVKA